MTADPFLITGPALISCSGGRTSAYMLWRILQAHGGTLPGDVVVAFANTGKEREETLRFVHECGTRWGVRVRWVEWRPQHAMDGDLLAADPAGFEEVGYNSASRAGEPFEDMVRRKQMLPNVTMRFCTTKLKVDTMRRLMLSLGHQHWLNPVGLRYDEGHRVLKQLARNDAGKQRYKAVMPLATGRVTKPDVMRFWLGPSGRFPSSTLPQGFDLGLRDHEGNCDLCFLKGRGALARLIADGADAGWWVRMEAETEARGKMRDRRMMRFSKDRSYAELVRDAAQPLLITDDMVDEHDAECGLWCGSLAA
ncbi:3'-phosphoadenosine 5'-phosphosulfate sulfotransferase [Caulobacter sp. S45]|uniref:3'-phosphoadenosine 5'-phosphosulfate sulfotransferase n=1 Tax=Caulobacter sp. S45 TaxID=1641861 RepID=UPI001576A723|nr:3'-phosphoadenosine 5'-phosphosulfate sulfotransferase [Caulobacter sp. S45]